MELRKISPEELKEILRKHLLWLGGKEGGERADLSYSDLSSSDLRHSDLSRSDLRASDLRGSDLSYSDLSSSDLSSSDLSHSDLSRSDLRASDLRGSDLSYSDLRGANLDYSCLPLWCGSLSAHFDDRQLRQIAYHLVKAGLQSDNASDETKAELAKLVDFANQFHRVEECGHIERM